VATFVGDVNLIEGRVIEPGGGVAVIADKAGRLYRAAADAAAGAEVTIAVRPEKVRIQLGFLPGAALNAVRGRVEGVGYLGGMSIYKVRLDDGVVVKAAVVNAARAGGWAFSAGDEVWLSWPLEAAVVLTG
jgi:putrescine transport system ATP-binding protein